MCPSDLQKTLKCHFHEVLKGRAAHLPSPPKNRAAGRISVRTDQFQGFESLLFSTMTFLATRYPTSHRILAGARSSVRGPC